MSYNIDVEFESNDQMIEALAWLSKTGLKHLVDWRWFWRNWLLADSVQCTFQFEDAKHAEWFSLRWA